MTARLLTDDEVTRTSRSRPTSNTASQSQLVFPIDWSDVQSDYDIGGFPLTMSHNEFTVCLALQHAGMPVQWTEDAASASFGFVPSSHAAVFDATVLPGLAATQEAFERTDRRQGLKRCIDALAARKEADGAPSISWETAKSGRAVIDALPENVPDPTVHDDGEGAIVLRWEINNWITVLIVEPSKLHLVVGATTPNVEYLDNVEFEGAFIPPRVLSCLPRR
jgi:hypothetical protein